jgi:membrane-associated phospholipid phosphatase
VLPQGAGDAIIAVGERWLPAEALACRRDVFRGCNAQGVALKWPLFFLSSLPTFIHGKISKGDVLANQRPTVMLGYSRMMARLLVLVLASVMMGCGTLSNGRGWGQDALTSVSWQRVRRAAHNAFFDVQTILPAAGAVIFAASDLDDQTSEWAIEHTPIFGSVHDAQNASDHLREILWVEAGVTALATPSGADSKSWLFWKGKGLAVEFTAMGVTSGLTSALKGITGRSRPDDPTDTVSFPSGHASSAFAASTLANRNLDALAMPMGIKRPLQVGNLLLATGVAWARVEGGRHFPSDVLAGAALGHFLSAFIHDAFLGLPGTNGFRLVILPAKDNTQIEVSFSF